jgi:hypothetical protein
MKSIITGRPFLRSATLEESCGGPCNGVLITGPAWRDHIDAMHILSDRSKMEPES